MAPTYARQASDLEQSSGARSYHSDAIVFRDQWINPSDILSLLLLIGPDIVQRAIAQLSGNILTPVAFSFGWVAYSLNASLSVIGGGNLMPDADFPCLVVGAKSGHVRNNKAWVVGRLLRDMEASADELLRKREAQHPAETRRVTNQVSTIVKSDWEALRVYVYVYRNEPGSQSGVPDRDWVCYMGFVVIAAQLALSVVPWALYASWGTFVVTVGGTFLSTFTSSLAQWADEKWACPRTSVTVTVTRGNGCRQASIILGAKDTGLDLEVLATGTRNALSSRLTKFVIPTLSIAWIILLICVAGMRDHSWYLLGIGTVGIFQNVLAAGAVRDPSALGFHLDLREVVKGPKVQEVLRNVEERYPMVGTSLLPVFFPGVMRVKESEVAFWREAIQKRMTPNEYGFRVDALPSEEGQTSEADDSPGLETS